MCMYVCVMLCLFLLLASTSVYVDILVTLEFHSLMKPLPLIRSNSEVMRTASPGGAKSYKHQRSND